MSPDQARFCRACGASLEQDVARPREVRKTVTILFSDLTGSTDLGERLDPEALRRVTFRFFDEMRAVLERHGGTVEKYAGDDVMAVFGVPRLHEDDAFRAVHAAAAMHAALDRLNEELERGWGVRLEMRIGINTGEVVTGDTPSEHTLATGDAVNLAKRIQQAAQPGAILLGKETYELVRSEVAAGPLESFSVKERRVSPWLVGSGGTVPARTEAPLVGRDSELQALEAHYQRAVLERRCRLVTVLGPAGVGKSRLARELGKRLLDASVVKGRCLPYGDGITFWPIREIVRKTARIGADDTVEDARRKIGSLIPPGEDSAIVCRTVAGALGLHEEAAAPEEIFWALRRFFEALARGRPLVLVVEDIHWAEPTLLDLLQYLEGWSRQEPILLLCLARPELLELGLSWQPPTEPIMLEPLSEAETRELVASLAADDAPRLAGRIWEAAEGNPLFAEEMLRMLTDENGDGEARIPPTINALLAARLDRLEADERAVAQSAAVIGRQFGWLGVTELVPPELRSRVAPCLQALVRRQVVLPDEPTAFDEDGFRFAHILMRDAAYQSLAKERRAELHERHAEWLERRSGERVVEYEEILGYHLEQAYTSRAELTLLDAKTVELGQRASTLLASAGRRALDRGDVRAAASLFGRAAPLGSQDHPEQVALAHDHATALMATGDLAEADRLLADAIEAAAATGQAGVWARALVTRAHIGFATHPTEALAEAESVAERAIETFSELGDEAGLARAWRLLAYAQATRGQWAATASSLENALEHVQRAGDRQERTTILSWLPVAFYYGPTPVEEAIVRCEDVLARARGERHLEAASAALLAPLLAMRGRFQEAREFSGRTQALLEDIGALAWLANARVHAAQVELLAGDPEAAERELRWAHETLQRMGDEVNAATVRALLAEALEDQDRDAEAERWTEVGDETVLENEVLARVMCGAARAKAVARAGRFHEAERLAQDAVAVAGETDALNLRAHASLALADVLRRTRAGAEATSAAAEAALALYRAKGNLIGYARAEQLLAELRAETGPVTAPESPSDPPSLDRPGG